MKPLSSYLLNESHLEDDFKIKNPKNIDKTSLLHECAMDFIFNESDQYRQDMNKLMKYTSYQDSDFSRLQDINSLDAKEMPADKVIYSMKSIDGTERDPQYNNIDKLHRKIQ